MHGIDNYSERTFLKPSPPKTAGYLKTIFTDSDLDWFQQFNSINIILSNLQRLATNELLQAY